MADKPRKHNLSSSMATAGWSTAKGGFFGALAVGAIGALVSGLVIGGVAALIPPLSTAAVTIGAVAAIIGGVASMAEGGLVGAIAGGMFGLARGGDKISRENQLYRDRMDRVAHKREIEMNNVGMAGMQQGYMAGFAEGQQAMLNQLRALQEQQLMASAQPQQCAGHAERIARERAAQAAAGQQLG